MATRGARPALRDRASLPELPTTAEPGYPDVAGENWQGVVVPTGTPKWIIALLNRETVKIVAIPEVRERLVVLGFDPVGSTAEEFAARAQAEFEEWAGVIRASNIKVR